MGSCGCSVFGSVRLLANTPIAHFLLPGCKSHATCLSRPPLFNPAQSSLELRLIHFESYTWVLAYFLTIEFRFWVSDFSWCILQTAKPFRWSTSWLFVFPQLSFVESQHVFQNSFIATQWKLVSRSSRYSRLHFWAAACSALNVKSRLASFPKYWMRKPSAR